MTPKGLLARFRSDTADNGSKLLWSDAEVCGYMHDAQQQLCRRVDGIRDATSPVTQITISAGEPWVSHDPVILSIRSATLVSTARPIKVLSYEDVVGMDGTTLPWPFTPSEMGLTGVVSAAMIGMEEDKLRLVRIPAADDALSLLVERLPIEPLNVDKGGALPDNFEVREEHHLALLMWMKHLGYGKQDAETFDGEKAVKMEAAFIAYCEQAKAEKRRRNSKPRLISYGGL